MKQKNILFSILNWGLGHASRSIPIIKYLQSEGYNVIICSDGSVIPFIKKEVDKVTYEILPAYNIHYRYSSMALNMLAQSPKLLKVFRSEKRQFQRLVNEYKPIITISDNRYGCYSNSCPSYFMGHQWNILQSNREPHKIASWINKRFISRFKAILVPDDVVLDWTGKMTENLPENRHHLLGILSRFDRVGSMEEVEVLHEKRPLNFLAILSGPEPARTNIEKTLIQYCKSKPEEKFSIIRGTSTKTTDSIPSNCISNNIVDKNEIKKLCSSAQVVICRSGYSSIMDYISLGIDRILFIPTPGQTEQEYLAERLSTFYSYDYLAEKDLNIKTLDEKLDNIMESQDRVSVSSLQINNQRFKKVIDKIINSKL